jgi:hypothetical protein
MECVKSPQGERDVGGVVMAASVVDPELHRFGELSPESKVGAGAALFLLEPGAFVEGGLGRSSTSKKNGSESGGLEAGIEFQSFTIAEACCVALIDGEPKLGREQPGGFGGIPMK